MALQPAPHRFSVEDYYRMSEIAAAFAPEVVFEVAAFIP